MVPIPTDNLKNERPIAVRTVAHVTFEKSGLNKKLNPSPAPGSVTLRMHTRIRIAKSSGISVLVTLSIPLETPFIMIAPTIARTAHCQNRD